MNKNLENTNSYSSIVKSTGIFGFIQFFKLLVGLVTNKVAAIFLGPVGIGILGLVKTTIELIYSFTSFGLSEISIREISSNTDNVNKLTKSVYILSKTALYIGILSAFVTILGSSFLSDWVFSTKVKFYWFILLSIIFVCNAYTVVFVSLFKSLRKLRVITYSNIISSVLACITTVFCYYFYQVDGVILSLILGSIITFVVNFLYFKRLKFNLKLNWSFKEYFDEASPFLKLGLFLSINLIFANLCNFLIRIFLKEYSYNPSHLGYYQVAVIFLTRYVGMIFSAMSSDFFPRLTNIHEHSKKVSELVNKQIDIALLIVTPLVLIMYLFCETIISLLYSNEFIQVTEILQFGLFSIIIKAVIFPLGYVFLAKGENKQYLIQELIGDLCYLVLSIVLYRLFDLMGLGLALLINFLSFGFYLFFLLKKKFNINFDKTTFSNLIFSTLIGGLGCLSFMIFKGNLKLFSLIVLCITSCVFSFYYLNYVIKVFDIFKKRN